MLRTRCGGNIRSVDDQLVGGDGARAGKELISMRIMAKIWASRTL